MEHEDALNKALQLMRLHGIVIVDPVNVTNINITKPANDLWSLLLITFPEDLANYLSELSNTTIRSLIDLIEFNLNHTDEEFHPQYAPNQLVFEWSNKLNNLSYANQSILLNKTRLWARQLGIDAA